MHMYDFPKSFSDAAVPARILQVALKVFAQPFPVGLTPWSHSIAKWVGSQFLDTPGKGNLVVYQIIHVLDPLSAEGDRWKGE